MRDLAKARGNSAISFPLINHEKQNILFFMIWAVEPETRGVNYTGFYETDACGVILNFVLPKLF